MPDDIGPKSPGTGSPSFADDTSRLGRFIQTYHGFLSTFVIGVAGLIATSIWQYRQSETAKQQADSQQLVAEKQAENNWKIEKAHILAQNLQVLSSQGPGNVEQKYGVLLSLTRGNILDSELAVSYALELGKENSEYMRSVLTNTEGKDYWRLARAYEPTCDQRYGVTRPVQICDVDKLATRSRGIADLVSDETQAALLQEKSNFADQPKGGSPSQPKVKPPEPSNKTTPLDLLKDERQVQAHAMRLTWLFTPTLINFYERRQWSPISKFESASTGARLIAALVLASARTGEFVNNDEAAQRERFHADHRKWLTQYLSGNACDAECKAKLVEVMLTFYEEAEGDYDLTMRALIEAPRAQSGPAVSHLHTRLLWCQVDGQDAAELRDRVLVPAAIEMLDKDKSNPETVVDLVGLLAIVKPPKDAETQAGWRAFTSALEKPNHARYAKTFADRKATAARERASPPLALKKSNFCIPAAGEEAASASRKTSR